MNEPKNLRMVSIGTIALKLAHAVDDYRPINQAWRFDGGEAVTWTRLPGNVGVVAVRLGEGPVRTIEAPGVLQGLRALGGVS